MTLEQLQSMSDAELDELAAVKVMGYHMYHYDKDYEENCYFLLMNGLDAVNPLSRGYKTEEEAWRDWNPTGDMNDAMVLLEQFNSYQITKSKSGFSHSDLSYRVIVSKNQNVAYSHSKTRTITIAAILAKEE